MADINLVTFCCENSAFLAAEKANMPGVKAVKVPCGGQIEHVHILKAFEEGADGVLVLACLHENCKHFWGNDRAEKKVNYVKGLLDEIGIGSDKLSYAPVASNNEIKYSELVKEMIDKLNEKGSTEGKVKK